MCVQIALAHISFEVWWNAGIVIDCRAVNFDDDDDDDDDDNGDDDVCW